MIRRNTTRCLLGAAIFGVWAVSVHAQDAAGPRPGPVYVLEVDIAAPGRIAALVEGQFNIGHVHGTVAEIFATPAERARLEAMGWNPVLIEVQPNPPAFGTSRSRALGVYHNYAGVAAELQAYAAAYPNLTRLESVGQSVQGRELWALLITDNPNDDEDEPELQYISTMHGDEPVGTEMCLYFIDHLLTNYGVDARVTNLVDETAIWVLPLMNPDGREAGSRFNANGFDLNRSFPQFGVDFFDTLFFVNTDTSGLEPEVAAIVDWTEREAFNLAANFHTGALVVSYPLDGEVPVATGVYLASEDDDLFVDFSLRYASNNAPMFASGIFPQGITNGNAWFKVLGSMQDYVYRFALTPAVTVELSNTKTPPQGLLPSLWNDNRESMLQYAEAVHSGIRGVVTDADTGDPIRALILVSGNDQPALSDPDVGDYHRVLLPGTYNINVLALGYAGVTVQGIVVDSSGATRVDIQMSPVAAGTGGARSALIAGALLTLTACAALRRKSTRTGNPA